MSHVAPTRNLGLDLVRVTEAGALSAGRFMGRGNKEAADAAAVNAMRTVLADSGYPRHHHHRRGGEGQRPHALQRRDRRKR